MIILGIVIGIAGLGALCRLLFNLAVFALPLFAGVWIGMAALQSGAGPVGAIVLGLVAGGVTLVLGRLVFTTAPSRLMRVSVGLLFAAPAAFAGYHATLGVAALAMPSEAWREVFAGVGAMAVGLTALMRLTLPPAPGRSPDRYPGRIAAVE